MERNIALAFPTPIGQFRVPEADQINPELRSLIQARERSEPSDDHANAGGWHSKATLFEWPATAVSILRGRIIEAVNHMVAVSTELMKAGGAPSTPSMKLRLTGWANILRKGNFHRIHNHPGSSWSGVYYVDSGVPVPNQPLNGVLELLDPRPFTEMVPTPASPFGQRLVFSPEAGKLILFPGWHYHFVNPYHGDGERISISFNASPTTN